MLPSSLSATSAQVFQSCPARWRAEFFERTPTLGGSAANLGNAVHAALDVFVKEGRHQPKQGFNELKTIYDRVYWDWFSDHDRYAEGLTLLDNWYQRTEFPANVLVVSTETKESFTLKAGGVEVPFNFIWDRCDMTTNEDNTFDVEVIDYKTVGQPIQPDDLKKRIQVRAYALSAAIKYPQAHHIWITYDLLRYDRVGCRFTREENVETYRYLQGLLRKILDSDGTEEKLNPECHWCLRAPVCETLRRHTQAGGILGIDDPVKAADYRAELEYAKGGIQTQIDQLDEFLLLYLEKENKDGFRTEATQVTTSVTGRRHVDPHRVVRVIGPDMMAEYGNMRMGDFDRLIKDPRLTDDQRRDLRQLVGKNYGQPSIKVKPISAVGDDE